jgi:hypothetical protein
MVCQYCNKRLGILQRLKGQQFCSLEHQELHFGLSFERLRESVTESLPLRAKPRLGSRPAQAEAQQPAASVGEPQSSPELPQAELVIEPPARDLAVEPTPTLEIASLVGAVGTANGGDLPEAAFLPEMPARQDQPAFSLKSYAAEPVSAPVRLPISPVYETLLRASPTLVLDVTPAQPPAEITPIANQPTWRPVPEGYPPVVVSASATLLLDANEAKLIPLRMGEPCRGGGPVPAPQTVAIDTPLLQPRLPARHGEYHPGSEQPPSEHQPASMFPRPPQAPACSTSWQGRIGRGPAVPQVAGILRPKRDVVRLAPVARTENFGALSSYPFFATQPESPVPPQAISPAAASLLEAKIAPRHTASTGKAPYKPRALELPKADNPRPITVEIPMRYEPSASKLDAPWVPSAVASQLPPAITFLPSGPGGLSMAADAVTLGCSSATSLPPEVEATGPVSNPIPALLLSRSSSLAVLVMPFWPKTRPLPSDACRLPSGASEHEFALEAANLQPSIPSPLSLVTWSQSLAVSIPARDPSNLGGPARIGLSAVPGRPQPLRAWSPSRRAYRVTPLIPEPAGIGWAPVAPIPTPQRPPVIQPIRPGSEGTAPPKLNLVRAQPASMPVLPPALGTFGVSPVTGLVLSGPSPEMQRERHTPFSASCVEETLTLVCIDMAHGTSGPAGHLRPEHSALLPSVSAQPHAPANGLTASSPKIWWSAIAPVQTVNIVQPFPALKRLATSLVACLPGPGVAA